MIRFFRSLWIWTASVLLVLFWLPLLALIWLFDEKPDLRRTGFWLRRLGRIVGRVTPWIIHIEGQENLDPNQVYLIVSNHQSLADIPLICYLKTDTKWTAPTQAARALLRGGQYLRQRFSVVFFPEGGRSTTGEVLPFNEGAFQLAIREQVPVLPLVVDGTSRALPRSSFFFSESSEIWLKVLPPVPVAGLDVKRGGAALRDQVRQSIVDELARLRQDHAVLRNL
jgi:1-acyl-sn-glycerol-3-phosphate acyltransferase